MTITFTLSTGQSKSISTTDANFIKVLDLFCEHNEYDFYKNEGESKLEYFIRMNVRKWKEIARHRHSYNKSLVTRENAQQEIDVINFDMQ